MEATRNLCAQIPVSLHDRVREERESLGQSLSEYVIQILKDHFEGGKTTMAATKTLAFQIPEELDLRIKNYLAVEKSAPERRSASGSSSSALSSRRWMPMKRRTPPLSNRASHRPSGKPSRRHYFLGGQYEKVHYGQL